MLKNMMLAIALTGLCLLSFRSTNAQSPASGRLSGKVVDDVEESGIRGASIQVFDPTGHLVVAKTSELDGTYKIDALPANKILRVMYQKEGYVPDEHEITVTAEQEGRLLNLNGSDDYYKRKASKIKVNLSKIPGARNEGAWTAEWTKIENAAIPPAAKGSIARELQPDAPQSLKRSGLFSAYATTDPDVLKRLDLVWSDPTAKHDWVAAYKVNADILDNIGKDTIETRPAYKAGSPQ